MTHAFIMDEATVAEAKRLIDLALIEDLGATETDQQLDVTTESVVPDNVRGSADFVSRKSGVVCGVGVAELVVDRVNRDLTFTVGKGDGVKIEPGDVIATLAGNAQDILIAERTCLNFMGILSGVSTMASLFVAEVAGTKAQVLDTRKTTPGWRHLEKFAVKCGGGTNHRMGLHDAVLIKDNHLAMMDSLTEAPMKEVPIAIENSREWIGQNHQRLVHGNKTILQVEVDTLEQLQKALPAGPDIVLLDNMSNEQLTEAVAIRDREAPQVLLEASGGVNLTTVGGIAKTGVDRISVGALTHSSVNLDIGLDWTLG